MQKHKSILAFSILVFSMLACQVSSTPAPQPAVTTIPTIVPVNTAAAELSAPQEDFVRLYENVSPGTVAIFTDQGQGSGFVYDAQGHIITNYHVIEGSKAVEVRFTSGYLARGTVVGTDLDSDLAVIKVNADPAELHPLPLGDSSQLRVGQTVVAIGNPFGLESTMTVGIISALERELSSMHQTPDGGFFMASGIIQTDAAINPGNSGGPLFNINGEVIGVNRAIITNSASASGEPVNSGIGFAIPINLVKRAVPTLITGGKYDYPFLGASFPSDILSLDEIEELGLTTYAGAYVVDIAPGGPADKAGIKAGSISNKTRWPRGGDLIVALDGVKISSPDELLAFLVTNKSPGDTMVVSVLRDNKRMDLTVTLGKRP